MGVSSNVNLAEILEQAPKNIIIQDSLTKAYSVLSKYDNVCCSVSGGSDSDLLVDICTKFDPDKRITYVWFDTGVEFQAKKDHLKYLEERYGIEIIREKATKPIPTSCREYGQPFISKCASEMINRLQKHNFRWEDKPFDELRAQYPKCESALKWWCNMKSPSLNINARKYLKEFIIENPPMFHISCKCCDFAKKDVAKNLLKKLHFDLMITGVRKAEGGVRATKYKSCFDNKKNANYRPIFWYSNKDKNDYCRHYGIVHSRCYTDYGMKRTGCVGCPFARDIDFELEVLKENEPKLYKVACFIFKDSYEYTKAYKEYRKTREMEETDDNLTGQMCFDIDGNLYEEK